MWCGQSAARFAGRYENCSRDLCLPDIGAESLSFIKDNFLKNHVVLLKEVLGGLLYHQICCAYETGEDQYHK